MIKCDICGKEMLKKLALDTIEKCKKGKKIIADALDEKNDAGELK